MRKLAAARPGPPQGSCASQGAATVAEGSGAGRGGASRAACASPHARRHRRLRLDELQDARGARQELRGQKDDREADDGGDVHASLRRHQPPERREDPLRGIVHRSPRPLVRLDPGELREDDPQEKQALEQGQDELGAQQRVLRELRVQAGPREGVGAGGADGAEDEEAADPDPGPLEEAQATVGDRAGLRRQQVVGVAAGQLGQRHLPHLDAGAERVGLRPAHRGRLLLEIRQVRQRV
mmetsp:Transcript_98756/g.260906  ORF Transcript_98756/g.260906 Transcript_98756/m.260906 type:complete len:239 (-) Transcript_98756:168-884(-)